MATSLLLFCQLFSGISGVILWAAPSCLQMVLFRAPLGPELLQHLWEYPDLGFQTRAKFSRILLLISQETGFYSVHEKTLVSLSAPHGEESR